MLLACLIGVNTKTENILERISLEVHELAKKHMFGWGQLSGQPHRAEPRRGLRNRLSSGPIFCTGNIDAVLLYDHRIFMSDLGRYHLITASKNLVESPLLAKHKSERETKLNLVLFFPTLSHALWLPVDGKQGHLKRRNAKTWRCKGKETIHPM